MLGLFGLSFYPLNWIPITPAAVPPPNAVPIVLQSWVSQDPTPQRTNRITASGPLPSLPPPSSGVPEAVLVDWMPPQPDIVRRPVFTPSAAIVPFVPKPAPLPVGWDIVAPIVIPRPSVPISAPVSLNPPGVQEAMQAIFEWLPTTWQPNASSVQIPASALSNPPGVQEAMQVVFEWLPTTWQPNPPVLSPILGQVPPSPLPLALLSWFVASVLPIVGARLPPPSGLDVVNGAQIPLAVLDAWISTPSLLQVAATLVQPPPPPVSRLRPPPLDAVYIDWIPPPPLPTLNELTTPPTTLPPVWPGVYPQRYDFQMLWWDIPPQAPFIPQEGFPPPPTLPEFVKIRVFVRSTTSKTLVVDIRRWKKP